MPTKTIVSVEDATHEVTIDASDRLYIDGKFYGFRRPSDWRRLEPEHRKVSILAFQDSSGEVHCVADKILRCGHPNNPIREVELIPTIIRLAGKWLDYDEAKRVVELGAEFRKTAPRPIGPRLPRTPKPKVLPGEPMPFYRDEWRRVLTNDKVNIPFDRPIGQSGWNRWYRIGFLSDVPKRDWELMLEIVEGKCLHEILCTSMVNSIYLVKSQRKQAEIEDRRRQREQAQAEKRLAAFIDGQCFNVESAVPICLGGKFIFSLKVSGQEIHVVDAPRYGVGLYLFDNLDDAKAWATGAVTFTTARSRAKNFIVHDKDGLWMSRASEALAAA